MREVRNCKTAVDRVGEDMISRLPDDLLVKIVDLIPTKDAAATMFLSKRWLSIWPMVPTLKYTDSDAGVNVMMEHDDDGGDDHTQKSVWWFLDQSLQCHKAPVIDLLCIKLGRRCPTDVDVGKWIANAVERCVREMIFKLIWSAGPISLPESLYSSTSLVELTLSHKICVDVPSTACLPSLTHLYLVRVVYKDEDSHVRFFSSCPVLKFLYVRRNIGDNVKTFTVKLPYLRSLYYDNDGGNDNNMPGFRLVIDTPSLESFNILNYSEEDCSIENIPCLANAFIHLHSCPDDRLRCISSVSSLQLHLTNEMLGCYSTIKFSRLIKLTLVPGIIDWIQPLMLLLQNSSQLKHLVVNCISRGQCKDLPLSWNQPSAIPECLLSQLETFEWVEYGGRGVEKQFLTYILGNSNCLKTGTISLPSTFSTYQQSMMIRKLKDIPRVSTTSIRLCSGEMLSIVDYP